MRVRSPAARAASSSSRPASSAASCSAASVPSTATARASAPAGAGSAARRVTSARETVSGMSPRTCAAEAATGAMPSRASAPASSCSRNGLPPLAAWHAAQNSSWASGPSTPRTTAAAPPALSGARCRTVAAGSAPSVAAPSPTAGRLATTSATGRPSSRRAR